MKLLPIINPNNSVGSNNKIPKTTTDKNQRYHARYQLAAHNQKLYENRKTHTLSIIKTLYTQSGKIPTINQIKATARCDYYTAKAALVAFELWLQAEKNKESLLLYVYSINTKTLSHSFTPNSRKKINNAVYALNNLCPDNIYHLTSVVPGNSQLGYLLVTQYSKHIADTFLEKIEIHLPEDFPFYYVYSWENQPGRLAPHCHTFLNLPNRLSQSLLTTLWFDVLTDLGDSFNINLFENENGLTYSRNNASLLARDVDLREYTIQVATNYKHTYLAKSSSKEPRELSIVGNKLVSFKNWYGISDSLERYAETLPLHIEIPVDRSDQVTDDIASTKSLINSRVQVNWDERINPYNNKKVGYKTRIDRRHYAEIKDLLLEQEVALKNRKYMPYCDVAINFFVIELLSNGDLILRPKFSRKNWKKKKEQEQEYKYFLQRLRRSEKKNFRR